MALAIVQFTLSWKSKVLNRKNQIENLRCEHRRLRLQPAGVDPVALDCDRLEPLAFSGLVVNGHLKQGERAHRELGEALELARLQIGQHRVVADEQTVFSECLEYRISQFMF